MRLALIVAGSLLLALPFATTASAGKNGTVHNEVCPTDVLCYQDRVCIGDPLPGAPQRYSNCICAINQLNGQILGCDKPYPDRVPCYDPTRNMVYDLVYEFTFGLLTGLSTDPSRQHEAAYCGWIWLNG